MPMWGGYWGAPWGGFGWIFPLIGLLFMVMMAFACFRMMGGCMAGRGVAGRIDHKPDEVEELRREVQELKDEIRKLCARS
jgi:hypothetical protein